mmetsp:Transcript_9657/g.40978  ORF Transcript_9657/g.40978 Transcript_9657/m.40978 type:complete len:215 (+) Transcript_9657:154-798(+)
MTSTCFAPGLATHHACTARIAASSPASTMASTTRVASATSTYEQTVMSNAASTASAHVGSAPWNTGHSSRTSRKYAETVLFRNRPLVVPYSASYSNARAATCANARARGSCSVPACAQHHASHASPAAGPPAASNTRNVSTASASLAAFINKRIVLSTATPHIAPSCSTAHSCVASFMNASREALTKRRRSLASRHDKIVTVASPSSQLAESSP